MQLAFAKPVQLIQPLPQFCPNQYLLPMSSTKHLSVVSDSGTLEKMFWTARGLHRLTWGRAVPGCRSPRDGCKVYNTLSISPPDSNSFQSSARHIQPHL